MSQLYRYFSVTDARFAILTNGSQFWFYSDLDKPNRMDQRPFFKFDILDYRSSHLAELSKFTKEQFDLDQILHTAKSLKYSSTVQHEFVKELENPSDEMLRIFASRVYDGRFTERINEEFREIVANALRESIRELVSKRLASALEVTNEQGAKETQVTGPKGAGEEGTITTEEELEAFHIVKRSYALSLQRTGSSCTMQRAIVSFCWTTTIENRWCACISTEHLNT
jgi:predicted type IV restriction endonuclease